MFERGALIHYHEIGLKGRNRSTFENRLRTNIAFAVGALTAILGVALVGGGIFGAIVTTPPLATVGMSVVLRQQT